MLLGKLPLTNPGSFTQGGRAKDLTLGDSADPVLITASECSEEATADDGGDWEHACDYDYTASIGDADLHFVVKHTDYRVVLDPDMVIVETAT